MNKMKFQVGDLLVIRPWRPIKSERVKVVDRREDYYVVETNWAGPASRRTVYREDLEREAELDNKNSEIFKISY